MKATIAGKRYDTDTAEEIAEFRSSLGRGDFGWYEETLYRTKKGAWFLFGSGHAASPYAMHYKDCSGPGSKFKVLTPDEAQRWLERRGETDLLDEYFADQIENA